MATDPFRHVRSGEPLVIPATAYNAMLDAGQAVRNRHLNLTPHGGGFDSLFIHVVNATGKNLERFAVVGLDGPVVTDISQNEDAFCERIIFNGISPTKEHKGQFAVLQEDAAQDMCVRACVSGVTIAKVQSDSETKIRFCDVKENDTSMLVSGGGGAEVLWHDKQSNWAIIRIGSGKSTLFPVTLSQTGGEQGDNENAASWTYSVTDALSDEELATDVDPTASPHQWKRPSSGAMTAATFGYAHYDNDDKLVVGWINEVPVLPDWSECCVCKPYTLATWTPSDYATWDLTEYQGDGVATPNRYWRLTNDYSSYVPFQRGCVDKNGKLVGLPNSTSTTTYKYTWHFKLEIGCEDGDVIRYPSGTESASLYNC